MMMVMTFAGVDVFFTCSCFPLSTEFKKRLGQEFALWLLMMKCIRLFHATDNTYEKQN
jgi:hypothetical protein